MPSPARRQPHRVVYCLQVCMQHLLGGVMRNSAEWITGFAALVGAVGDALTLYLPAITPLLREAVSKREAAAKKRGH